MHPWYIYFSAESKERSEITTQHTCHVGCLLWQLSVEWKNIFLCLKFERTTADYVSYLPRLSSIHENCILYEFSRKYRLVFTN